MRRKLLVGVILVVMISMIFPATVTANPGLTFFTNRADFEAVCVNLQVEDFEEGNIDWWGVGIPRPLDSTTDNAYFSPGDIVAGLSITTTGPASGLDDELALFAGSSFGNPSKCILANYWVDTLAVDFTISGVTCVGMDLLGFFADPNLKIDIYGTSGLLGSTTAPCTSWGSFWGVCSDEGITRITIYSLIDDAEGVDNIAFGTTKNLPPGWSKGNKSGWDGTIPSGLDNKGKTPPGFEQGNKTGWKVTP